MGAGIIQQDPISIHSLRVEGDGVTPRQQLPRQQFQSTPSVWRETGMIIAAAQVLRISIHSLRVEGDYRPSAINELRTAVFQSTPSVWRETMADSKISGKVVISIHSLRVEGDRINTEMYLAAINFNPLPPCGGRRRSENCKSRCLIFQSTPSVWRETCLTRLIMC